MPWIDKNLCIGCGICTNVCPDGFEIKDKKYVVKNPNASCISKAMSACPVGAIKPDTEKSTIGQTQSTLPPKVPGTRRGTGRGGGRGLGIGPRDGRGHGKGGGGRGR